MVQNIVSPAFPPPPASTGLIQGGPEEFRTDHNCIKLVFPGFVHAKDTQPCSEKQKLEERTKKKKNKYLGRPALLRKKIKMAHITICFLNPDTEEQYLVSSYS